MPKKHGPDFKKEVGKVEGCRTCRTSGVKKGLFYELPCDDCKGVGWVAARGMELTIEEIARALGVRVNHAEQQLADRIRLSVLVGDSPNRVGNNRKGSGGSHFTGD